MGNKVTYLSKEMPPPTPPKQEDAAGASPVNPAPKKKFLNGWTREIEKLMAEWADKAVCYRWMHEKTERIYKAKDYAFMFPVIILSTVTGAANFAMDSVLTDPEHKTYAQLALGGLSIATGIISTIANRLGYASGMEAHKGASQLWGKFQRLIAIELSLHPNERTDCMHFLKMCRAELDRLIEQSPSIPESVIEACRVEFLKYPNVRKPEIVGDIDTTRVYVDTDSRLRQIAKEAAITIAQKKGVLKQIVLDDLEPRISRVLESSAIPALREDLKKEAAKAAREAVLKKAGVAVTGDVAATLDVSGAPIGLLERRTAERVAEVQNLAMRGVVSEMRQRLAVANSRTGEAPTGIGRLFADIPGSIVTPDNTVIHVSDDEEEVDESNIIEIQVDEKV